MRQPPCHLVLNVLFAAPPHLFFVLFFTLGSMPTFLAVSLYLVPYFAFFLGFCDARYRPNQILEPSICRFLLLYSSISHCMMSVDVCHSPFSHSHAIAKATRRLLQPRVYGSTVFLLSSIRFWWHARLSCLFFCVTLHYPHVLLFPLVLQGVEVNAHGWPLRPPSVAIQAPPGFTRDIQRTKEVK